MHSHKHILRGLGTLCVFLVCALLPLAAHAAGTGLSTGVIQGTALVMAYIVTALHLFTWIFFLAANILLDPNFIFNMDSGGQSNLVDLLNSIWMLSRDLMNVGFALLLIFSAVYVLVTDNRDLIKSHFQKFVAVVILVNFSWFIPRVIMDVGNVVTSTIYNVPSLINNNGQSTQCEFTSSKNWFKSCQLDGPRVPPEFKCPCFVVTNAEFFVDKQRYNNIGNQQGWDCPLGELLCLQAEELANHDIAGHSYILNGLIVNHARLLALSSVPVVNGQNAGGNSNATVTALFFMMSQALVLLIHVAMFFPLAAMVIAFAIRIPILWMTVAFMPFATLAIISPIQMGKELGQQIFDNFIKAAFLPALVAVPLTIGFILVNAGTNVSWQSLDTVPIQFLQGIGNFYQLLWLIIVLGVMWVGTFAALGKGGIMGKASESIKAAGEGIGKFAAKAPLQVPIIPTPAGSVTPAYALKSLRGAVNNIDSNPEGLLGIADKFKTGDLARNQTVREQAPKLKTAQVQQLTQAIESLRTKIQNNASANDINEHITNNIQPIINAETNIDNVREVIESHLIPHLNDTIDQTAKTALVTSVDSLERDQN